MSSTLKDDESGEPFHVQQRKQIEVFREEWAKHDHGFEPRVSVSRSIFAITSDLDKEYFCGGGEVNFPRVRFRQLLPMCQIGVLRLEEVVLWLVVVRV